MKKNQIESGEIPNILDIIAEAVTVNAPENRAAWRAYIERRCQEVYGEKWTDEAHCINCSAKMYQYTYKLDYSAAIIMMKLGKYVRSEMDKGKTFTEANKIHISGLDGYLTANQIDRKTILMYLGLLAKVKKEGKHIDSLWAITKWGFSFLRGDRVPKAVKVWRKEILERSDEQVSIYEVMSDAGTSTELEGWKTDCFSFELHEGQII